MEKVVGTENNNWQQPKTERTNPFTKSQRKNVLNLNKIDMTAGSFYKDQQNHNNHRADKVKRASSKIINIGSKSENVV